MYYMCYMMNIDVDDGTKTPAEKVRGREEERRHKEAQVKGPALLSSLRKDMPPPIGKNGELIIQYKLLFFPT